MGYSVAPRKNEETGNVLIKKNPQASDWMMKCKIMCIYVLFVFFFLKRKIEIFVFAEKLKGYTRKNNKTTFWLRGEGRSGTWIDK